MIAASYVYILEWLQREAVIAAQKAEIGTGTRWLLGLDPDIEG
jgi:hypothetical protein